MSISTSTRFDYSCATCSGKVFKTPCEKPPEAAPKVGKDGREKKEREHKVEYSGLGGWRCENCGAGIKVKRELVERKLKV